MINPAMFREISNGIVKRFVEADEDDTRYCLIVWSDEDGSPAFIGGNDQNMLRVLKMLAIAGSTVESIEGIKSGTA